jgi:hypothetical protein
MHYQILLYIAMDLLDIIVNGTFEEGDNDSICSDDGIDRSDIGDTWHSSNGAGLSSYDRGHDRGDEYYRTEQGGDDCCDQCNGVLQIDGDELFKICVDCGLKINYHASKIGRDHISNMTIVGRESYKFKKDVYTSAIVDDAELQESKILAEYLDLCKQYEDAALISVRKDMIQDATTLYLNVRNTSVRRGSNKLAMMAAVYYFASLKRGYVPTETLLCNIFSITSTKLRSRINEIKELTGRAIPADEIELDPLISQVETMFSDLGLDKSFSSTTIEIMRKLHDEGIGNKIAFKVRLCGVVMYVMHADILPVDIIDKLSSYCNVKPIAIKKFVDKLIEYKGTY